MAIKKITDTIKEMVINLQSLYNKRTTLQKNSRRLINKEQLPFAFGQTNSDKPVKYTSDSAYDPGGYGGIESGVGFYDGLVGENYFQGYAQLAYYRQNPFVNLIVSTPATEMTRKFISFNTVSEQDKTDRIKQLEKAFKSFHVKSLIKTCIESTMLYGGVFLSIKLKGDEEDLIKPLLIDKSSIGKGSLEYFKVIDPLYCTVGAGWNTTNPMLDDFYSPQQYVILGQQVHVSRLMKFVYIESPYILKPMYRFFGIPLIQICIRHIERLQNMLNSQEDIIGRYNLSIIKSNLNAILNGGNASTLVDRMELFNSIKDNNGALIIDKDSEEFEQTSMNVTGVTDNIRQALELICAITKNTSTKLLSISPSGFNASGDYETRQFDDHIASTQEEMLRDNLTKIMHIIMLNEFGEIDEEIDFEFEPLWEANELEESQIRLNETNRAVQNITAGITSREDEVKRLVDDPKSGYESVEGVENDQMIDYEGLDDASTAPDDDEDIKS